MYTFQIVENGTCNVRWTGPDVADFIEDANALICADIHASLSVLQGCKEEIQRLVNRWTVGRPLDEFTAKNYRLPDTIENIEHKHKEYMQVCRSVVTPSGHKIRSLVEKMLHTLRISEVSPAWQNFLLQIDQLVVAGLNKSVMAALHAVRHVMDPVEAGEVSCSSSVNG